MFLLTSDRVGAATCDHAEGNTHLFVDFSLTVHGGFMCVGSISIVAIITMTIICVIIKWLFIISHDDIVAIVPCHRSCFNCNSKTVQRTRKKKTGNP